MSLMNLAVVLVNGSTNAEYLRVPLAGSIPANGYIVITNANLTLLGGTRVTPTPWAAGDNVQNGSPDGIAQIFGSKPHDFQVNGRWGDRDMVGGLSARCVVRVDGRQLEVALDAAAAQVPELTRLAALYPVIHARRPETAEILRSA